MTPEMLRWMDHRRFFDNGESSRPGIDAFFRRTASEAQDPVLRGAARYYLAAGLARAVIESWRFSIEPGDTDPMRQGALAAAGRWTVAAARQRALDAATGLSAGVEDEEFVEYGPGGPTVRTFAEAESELTWCAPCVDALPDLRELVAELPADRFALVAVSVDEDWETVKAADGTPG